MILAKFVVVVFALFMGEEDFVSVSAPGKLRYKTIMSQDIGKTYEPRKVETQVLQYKILDHLQISDDSYCLVNKSFPTL